MNPIIKRLDNFLSLACVISALIGLLQIGEWVFKPKASEHVAFLSEKANRYERAQSSVVLIETATGYGSGAVIHRGPHTFVWTANHVVQKANEVKVSRSLHTSGHKAGKIVFKGKVIGRFPQADAALIYVDCPLDAFSAVKFATVSPRPGDEVFLVSNPNGEFFDGSVVRGIISQSGVEPEAEEWPWNFPLDQADFSSTGGSSGGPVFNWSGEVLGLFVGGPAQGNHGISCITPVRAINNAAVSANYGMFVYDNGTYPSLALIDFLAEHAKIVAEIKPAVPTIVIEVPKKKK